MGVLQQPSLFGSSPEAQTYLGSGLLFLYFTTDLLVLSYWTCQISLRLLVRIAVIIILTVAISIRECAVMLFSVFLLLALLLLRLFATIPKP